ncbi:MAG: hypothetical protein UR14_C0007G0034 [candidate division TM6 bacterium GW2011_GWE2_31_21]|nr:MAG: hypothetical protein UR14_C0007G0034 [candidate division TM6 bacterium GW2011_GWE2_31_21]KKP53605.1 MAG: hypothetical protein UR43_C0004G0146 [candidate division TM6 bacterium GW2011_GWF2_33_332]
MNLKNLLSPKLSLILLLVFKTTPTFSIGFGGRYVSAPHFSVSHASVSHAHVSGPHVSGGPHFSGGSHFSAPSHVRSYTPLVSVRPPSSTSYNCACACRNASF